MSEDNIIVSKVPRTEQRIVSLLNVPRGLLKVR